MDLSGIWYNELNSILIISVRSDGTLSGSYTSGVGSSAPSLLLGLYSVSPRNSTNVGWIVNWKRLPSLTAWSGQAWDDPVSGQILVAMWHLTSGTSESQQSQSTLSGKDVFTRYEKSDEEVAIAMRSVAPSHPQREL